MSIYTDWFPPEVKPAHKGLYECQCCYQKFLWDGATWWTEGKAWVALNQKITWRGLKEKTE